MNLVKIIIIRINYACIGVVIEADLPQSTIP